MKLESSFLPGWSGLFVTTRAGSRITDCIDEAIALARQIGMRVVFVHNGYAVEAEADSNREDLYGRWKDRMDAA